MSFDVVLCGGEVWLPGGPVHTDIGVHNGTIVAFGRLTGKGRNRLICLV